MKDLNRLTIKQISEGLKNKDFSAEDLTKSYLGQIKKLDGSIESFLLVNEKEALKKAKELDKTGDFSNLLAGIPYGVKDVYCTKEIISTGASKILENYIPSFNATVVEKIEADKGIIIGKTNCDEFAQGGSGENSGFYPTKNPWDLKRVPGGSSSGSAAAVAAGMCAYALGTDTGGSIRQPASFCGVTGLKVTYGRVSRYGVMAMTSSLDTIGPITKTVEDAAIVLEHIAGRDQKDATTPEVPVDEYSKEISRDIKGLKIGLPKEYFVEGVDEGVKKVVMQAADKFKELGAEIIDISLPHTDSAVSAYYIICPSEVSTNMSRYDGVRYGLSKRDSSSLIDMYKDTRSKGFGAEVKRRIMIGTYSLSAGYYDAYYNKAAKVRTLVRQDFDQAFSNVDVILTPVAPTPAFKLGENTSDPLKMYLADIFTIPASLAGICGLSIPAGFVDGLPVGIQLLGNRFDEKTILRAGHQYQLATDWHTKFPQAK